MTNVRKEINRLIRFLITLGLVNHHRFSPKSTDNSISIPGAEHLSYGLKDRPYSEIYRHYHDNRVYNMKMIDGALIQLGYRFSHKALVEHRLAFLPAPAVKAYRDADTDYSQDRIDTDIVDGFGLPLPVRFDFSSNTDGDWQHSPVHLTLGVCTHYRIPVTNPLTPYSFIEFILRYNYDSREPRYSGQLRGKLQEFPEFIRTIDRKTMYIVVPASDPYGPSDNAMRSSARI